MTLPAPARRAAARRFLAALLAATIGAMLLGASPATAKPDEPDTHRSPLPAAVGRNPGDALTVAITDISPTVLEPQEDLVVTGELRNDTNETIDEPRLRLQMQQYPPISRSALERWLEGSSLSATQQLAIEDLDATLPPQESRRFSIRASAEELGHLGTAAWGPRGLEVLGEDTAEPHHQPASDRNYLLWWPDIEVEELPIATMGALVPTASERSRAREQQDTVAATATNRLLPLLSQLREAEGAVVFDSSLLAATPEQVPGEHRVPTAADEANAATPEATTSPEDEDNETGGEHTAAGRLQRDLHELTEAEAQRAFVLPWSDPDVAALAHTGHDAPLDAARQRAHEVLDDNGIQATQLGEQPTGPAAVTSLAWPVADQPDRQTLELLQDTGLNSVVLDSDVLPPATTQTYTPAGRATVSLADGDLEALLADEHLSGLLSGQFHPIEGQDEEGVDEVDDLLAQQLLLAETAVILRERPADPRSVLLAVERDFDGDAEALGARLDALHSAPWIGRVPAAEMLEEDAPELPRDQLADRVEEPGEITADDLSRSQQVVDHTRDFTAVLTDPDPLLTTVRNSLLPLTSASWRNAPARRGELLSAAEEAASARHNLIAAQPGSTLNLINEEAHLPVSVTNELEEEAQVVVHLRPRDPRLAAEDVPLTIPPQESALAQVPVHAVGSGDVVVDVQLTAPSGEEVGQQSQMEVRVRAGWETVGTAVVAGLLVVMLVVGLVRTVRRGSRMKQDQR